MRDDLGDRIKKYENLETERVFVRNVPIVARLDGRSFSAFTRNMHRPFDVGITVLMRGITVALARQFLPDLAYTQSDEITLVWKNNSPNPNTEMPFGGKIFKLTSLLASAASINLVYEAPMGLGEAIEEFKPTFDCRVFQVPSLIEAYNTVLWRTQDAEKNSISMLARCHFSHKELQGKTGNEMKQMLLSMKLPYDKFVENNWDNYPTHFRYGTVITHKDILVNPDDLDLQNIPEKFRPTSPVIRGAIKQEEFANKLELRDIIWSTIVGEKE